MEVLNSWKQLVVLLQQLLYETSLEKQSLLLSKANVLKQDDFYDKYKSCFEGLGMLKDFQLDINIDGNIKPVS